MTTGLVVVIQSELLFLSVNHITGLASAVPASVGNRLGFCTDTSCSAQNPGAESENILISFIAPTFSCELADQNPPRTGPLSSGYLSSQTGTGIFSKYSNLLLPPNEKSVDILFVGSASLNAGILQVCLRPNGSDTFITTGISLSVQDAVLGLVINGVQTDSSPTATVSTVLGQSVSYFRLSPGHIGEEISFIPISGPSNCL